MRRAIPALVGTLLGALVGALVPLAAAVPASAQQEGRVEVTLSAKEATVGDRIEAKLELFWSGPAPLGEPELPTWKQGWGQAEVLEAGPVSKAQEAGQTVWRQTLALTAFGVGEIALPPVVISMPVEGATRELTTPAGLGFKIVSVLPEKTDEPLEPRPAAAPVPVGSNAAFWVAAGVLAGLCALCLVLLARRLGQLPAEAPRPALPPLDELLETLRRLDPAGPPERVHTGLSLALRGFLARTLAIAARESTTSEIRGQLRSASVPAAAAQQTVQLLRDCDQVKFGRLEVPATLATQRLETARTLARQIEASRRPAEPEAVAKPAQETA